MLKKDSFAGKFQRWWNDYESVLHPLPNRTQRLYVGIMLLASCISMTCQAFIAYKFFIMGWIEFISVQGGALKGK